ncbi:hypothetical protein NEOLI_003715 [Neolecta irregularis DAH-3]|uniref:Uncharacterized protein n=1 Tax=Neolecta irregularis (strain DAH-3) TaxID=1198029 RepID=A0A1U7LU32_NEOID|nr:hypothetical protein NEOLI_003715 [Neolecta irregularis DAH-3]|eukprot:OLL26185.1 hypothetical protein NEOLI_003715 [Neolecta irregularis DAH-3]
MRFLSTFATFLVLFFSVLPVLALPATDSVTNAKRSTWGTTVNHCNNCGYAYEIYYGTSQSDSQAQYYGDNDWANVSNLFGQLNKIVLEASSSYAGYSKEWQTNIRSVVDEWDNQCTGTCALVAKPAIQQCSYAL